LTINALIAADEVVIPVQAEYYSLEGIGQLLQTIELLQNNLAHPIKIAGAVLTMVDRAEKFSREVAHNLRTNFPHYIFKTEVPRSIPLAEAPSFARPVVLHRPDSDGAKAYEALAKEVLAQELPKIAAAIHSSPDFGNFNV